MSVSQFKSSYSTTYNSTSDLVGQVGEMGETTGSSLITKTVIPFISYPRFSQDLNATNLGSEVPNNTTLERSPVDRVYPHIFDNQTISGGVLALFKDSVSEAKLAVEAYNEPDMVAVGTRLTNIAVIMSKAHPMADFNRSLSGVISYIRRATLTTPAVQIDRPALNIMINVLNAILLDPMINLDDASDLTEKLSQYGWTGELDVIEKLIAALMTDTDDEEIQEEAQSELFTDMFVFSGESV